MKDKQIKEVMGSIENRIRHIYNCGYQQGYEDGKKAVNEQAEKITYTDIDEAYKRGYEDGRKDIIKQSDFSYQRGLEDAWECVRKIGRLDVNDQKAIFGTYTTRQIAIEFTVKEAMQKIKEYEERQTEDTEEDSNIKKEIELLTNKLNCTVEVLGEYALQIWEQMRKESHD